MVLFFADYFNFLVSFLWLDEMFPFQGFGQFICGWMVIAYLVQSFITLWYDLAKWHMYIVLPFRQVMITAKYNLIYLTTGQWGRGKRKWLIISQVTHNCKNFWWKRIFRKKETFNQFLLETQQLSKPLDSQKTKKLKTKTAECSINNKRF